MPAADPARDPMQPLRTLGVLDVTTIVIGAIIGVGIFFNPSHVAGVAGSAGLALLAWALAGLVALLGALTFASLGTRYHRSGAQYDIIRDAYGPGPAFTFVFCNATAVQAGAVGIIAVLCARYAVAAIQGPQAAAALSWPAQLAISGVLIAGLCAANVVGVKWGAGIQTLTVLAKLLTLGAVTGLAAVTEPAPPSAVAPAPPVSEPRTLAIVAAVLAAMVPACFAYGGWQHALWISGEVRAPQRTLPRAIIGGVLIVVAVYLAANWAYLHLLGHSAVSQSKALAADAVAAAAPALGGRIVAAAVALSAFGVLNAQLLSGPRLIYALAADGRFFSPFAALHPRFGTPAASILLLGAVGFALIAAAGFDAVDRLTVGVVFVDGVFFALTGAALIVLRRRAPGEPWPLRVPAAVPALFVLGELGVVAGSYLDPDKARAALIGLVWIAAAAALYAARFRRG